MDELIGTKLAILDELANQDVSYREMLENMREMERQIDELELVLSETQRDLIWDFWGLSTEMDRRKLELACQYVEFKETP